MYKLGKYEIHNWVTDGSGTFRLVVDREKVPWVNRSKILINHPCYDGGKDKTSWEVFLENNIFAKEYNQFGFKMVFYSTSLEKVKEQVDLFLSKLNKLKAFL